MSSFGFLQQFHRQPVSECEREERIRKTCLAIVSVLKPKRVYLFGSAMSGEMFDSSSDVDCLAVLETEERARVSWKHFGEIRRQLRWSLDLICLSESEFQRKKDMGGIAFIAAHEGRMIYEEPIS